MNRPMDIHEVIQTAAQLVEGPGSVQDDTYRAGVVALAASLCLPNEDTDTAVAVVNYAVSGFLT